jgi:DNA-binding NarL/FixJ family response regulator
MDLLLIDSESDALLLERLLANALGARVHRVDSLGEADGFTGSSPGVIITDLHLPDGHGVDVVRHLHVMHPNVPLLVLVGDQNEGRALECLRAGAQDYLARKNLTAVAVAKAVLCAVQRKHFEAQLERELMEIIAAHEEVAGLQGNLDQLLNSICERTQRVVPATGAVVELPDGMDMVYRACSGTAAPHLGLRVKISESLSGLAYTTGEILRCDDIETDSRVDRAASRRVGLRSMIVVPLRHANETIGAIKAISTEPYAFTALDVGKLRVLSHVLARLLAQAKIYAEKQQLVDELQLALADVRRLSGLLPICSKCKKIRDDKGYWTQVEQYIGEHSTAEFTHSLCPDCAAILFGPELAAAVIQKLPKPDSATPFAGQARL